MFFWKIVFPCFHEKGVTSGNPQLKFRANLVTFFFQNEIFVQNLLKITKNGFPEFFRS